MVSMVSASAGDAEMDDVVELRPRSCRQLRKTRMLLVRFPVYTPPPPSHASEKILSPRPPPPPMLLARFSVPDQPPSPPPPPGPPPMLLVRFSVSPRRLGRPWQSPYGRKFGIKVSMEQGHTWTVVLLCVCVYIYLSTNLRLADIS